MLRVFRFKVKRDLLTNIVAGVVFQINFQLILKMEVRTDLQKPTMYYVPLRANFTVKIRNQVILSIFRMEYVTLTLSCLPERELQGTRFTTILCYTLASRNSFVCSQLSCVVY